MANNSNSDIFMLFGVEGGSSISSGSGELIYTTLKQIISNIEKAGLNVKINADVANKNELQKQIQDSLADLSKSTQSTPIPISVSISPKSVINGIQSALNSHGFDVKLKAKNLNINKNNVITEDNGVSPISSIENESTVIKQAVNDVERATEDAAQNVEKVIDSVSAKAVETATEVKYALSTFTQSKVPYLLNSENYKTFSSTGISGDFAAFSPEQYAVRMFEIMQQRIRQALTNKMKSLTDVVPALPLDSTATIKEQARQRIVELIQDIPISAMSSLNSDNAVNTIRNKMSSIVNTITKTWLELPNMSTATMEKRARVYDEVYAIAKHVFVDYFKMLDLVKNSSFGSTRQNVYQVLNDKMRSLSSTTLALPEESTATKEAKENIEEETEALQENTEALNENTEAQNELTKAQQRALANAEKTRGRAAAFINQSDNLSQEKYEIGNNDDYVKFEARVQKIKELYSSIRNGEAGFDIAKSMPYGIETYIDALEELNKELNKGEGELKEFKNLASNITDDSARLKLEEYTRALKELREAPGGSQYADTLGANIIPSDLQSEEQLLRYVKEHYNEIAEATRNATKAAEGLNRQYNKEQNNITQRNKIYQEADNYYKKYQSGIKANITLNQRWLDLLEKINTGGFTDNQSARRAFAELQTETKKANAEVLTLWGTLKKLFKDHFGTVSATAFIGTLRNVAREAYQNVLNIDKAMTELRKVTDLTEQQYEHFMGAAADLANDVGGTIADTINSVADYSRLGYDISDSEALAKAALVYKNVGDGIESIDEATESIISTIKAFNMEAEDSMNIIDTLNILGNNLPISSGALGTALKKSASALAAGNNTLEESLSLISAANSTIQNEEVTGTALKTISMYLRAAKTEAEDAGIETDGMAESVSKLREELKALSGVDIMLDDKNFKSTYQIIKELSEVWDTLSDISQANILEKIGGKRNANVNAALIENFEIAEKAMSLTQKASGSALEENEKYLDSIEGHINRLKISYEDLSQTVIDSDLIKTGTDFLTNLLGGLNSVTKTIGTLPTLITTTTAALSATKDVGIFQKADIQRIVDLVKSKDFKGILTTSIDSARSRISKNLISNELNEIISQVDQLGKSGIDASENIKLLADEATTLGELRLSGLFSDWAREGDKAKISMQAMYETILDGNTRGIGNVSDVIKTFNESIKSSDAQEDYANAVAKTNTALGEYLKTAKQGEASTIGYVGSLVKAKLASFALTAATTALNAAISFVASLIISTIVKALNLYSESINKVQEAVDSMNASEEKIESINKELSETIIKIDELSKKDKLTLFESDELNNLKKINDELERQKNIEEANLLIQQKQARESALAAWKQLGGIDSKYNNDDWGIIQQTVFESNLLENLGRISSYIQGKSIQNIHSLTSFYEVYKKELDQLISEDISGEAARNPNSRLNYVSQKLEETKSQLINLADIISPDILISQLDPEKDKEAIDFLVQFKNAIDDINGVTVDKTFTDVWNNPEFTLVTNDLKKLAAQGELTIESFSHVAGIDKFTNALAEIGINDVSEVIAAIMQWVKDSGNAAEVASLQLSDYAKQLESIKSILDDKSSLRSTIQSTFNTVINGESLSDDDIQKLRDYPELFSKLTKTTDGWTISVDALSDAYSKLGSEARNAINEAKSQIISERQTQIDKYNANQVSSYSINSPEAYKNYLEGQAKLQSEIDDSNNALNSFNVLLQIYDDKLKETSKDTEDWANDVKNLSSNLSTGANAQKEMNENGKISVDTFLSLLSVNSDYAKCITITNGEIKFNAELYKDLEKAKIADEIATTKLTEAEIIYNRNQAAMYGNSALANELNKLLSDTQNKRRVLEALKDSYDTDWGDILKDKSDKTEDTVKENFDSFMREYEKLHDRGLMSDEDYYNKLEEANEQFYKNCEEHLDDYIFNETRIYNARKEKYKSDTDEMVDAITEQYEKGFITAEQYIKALDDLGTSRYGKDSKYADTEFANDELKALADKAKESRPDVYDERLNKLQRFNDKSLDDEAEYVRQWKSLNDEMYKGIDNTKYEANLTEIASYEKDLLDRQYKEGLISAEKYRDSLIKLWENNDALLGEGVLNEWLSSAVDNIKAELDRLYKEGKITAKEYFESIQSLWEQNENILGQRTQEEWMEEAWKNRAETEKTYWEQQKDLAADYYDAELKKLEDVQDAEEKINKAEELRLNLIKARQKLEEAKSQKNQLLFNNGTFEYVADQEAIMSAEEEVAEALKEIKDNQLQQQIDLLNEQKDEALLFYDNIISLLDYYLNGTVQIESSDPEVIEQAKNSNSGSYWMRLFRGEITLDEIKESTANSFTKDETKSSDTQNKVSGIAKQLLGLGTVGLMSYSKNLLSSVPKEERIGLDGISSQDNVSSAINNVYNNSDIANDNSVNVGDIHMTIQGGTSQDMLNQFVSELGSALKTAKSRALAY